MLDQVRGAVISDEIIEFRVAGKLVGALEHVDQEGLDLLRGGSAGIEINIDLPHFGPQGDDIALIGDQIHQLETFVGASHGGVSLSLLESSFDRDDKMSTVP